MTIKELNDIIVNKGPGQARSVLLREGFGSFASRAIIEAMRMQYDSLTDEARNQELLDYEALTDVWQADGYTEGA